MDSNSSLQFCTVEEVVAAAFLRFDTQDSRDEIVFTEWAYDALREIGPGPEDIEIKCVSVDDLCFEKPCNLMQLIDLQLVGAQGEIFYYQFSQNRILDSELSNTRATPEVNNSSRIGTRYIVVSEQDKSFILSSNASAVAKAEMSYFTFPVDEEGNMKIRENLKLPIIAYIEYQFYTRERHKLRRKGNFVTMNEIQFYKDNWIGKLRQAKGRQKMPNAVSAETIARKWNTLIPNWKDSKRNSNFFYNITRRR